MRDIAKESQMAGGAAYYHFKSKDDLIFAFYQEMQKSASERNRKTVDSTKSFSKRLEDAFSFKLEELSKNRPLMVALSRSAADPLNPLSPFSIESKEIRDRAIYMFEELIEGSDLKVGKELRKELKHILWIHYLGIIFFWAHDPSPGQKLTKQLNQICMKLLKDLLPFSRLPFTTPIQKAAVKLSQTIMGLVKE